MIEKGTWWRFLSIVKLLGETNHRSGNERSLVPAMHLPRTDENERGTSDGIFPKIGKKMSLAIKPEDFIIGMTVKTKSIWPGGDGLLETPDEELVGRRHLRPVIREGSDWHIPRSSHADNIIASFLTLNEKGTAFWAADS